MHYVAHMVQEKQCRSYMKVLNKRAPLLGDRFYNTRLSRAITNGEASKMEIQSHNWKGELCRPSRSRLKEFLSLVLAS